MRFITKGTVVAVAAAAATGAIAGTGEAAIYHCNQATQHCVSGTVPYNVDAEPPGAADRRGLLQAFDHVHHSRTNLALVGFRIVGPHSAAAYYLITGADHSTYAAGHTDLFHRTHGHSWVHVKRFKNANPGWNDVDNLSPGFLWKATSDGSGTYTYRQSTAADDGSDTTTFNTQVSFGWNSTYAGGRVLNIDNGYANGNSSLAGQISAGTADSSDPAEDASCTGSVNDAGGGGQPPRMSFAAHPSEGKTKDLDFTLDLVNALSWPSSCNSDWAMFPDGSRFVAGAREPVATLEHDGFYGAGGAHARAVLSGQAFDVPVDDTAPTAAGDAMPHQSASSDDGSNTITDSEDLKLVGTLHFKLVGMWMPLGYTGFPHRPLHADGHTPPVL